MTQQFPQQPYQPAPHKPAKKPMTKAARRGWSILAGFGIFALGAGIGAAGGSDPSTPVAAGDPAPTVTITVPVPAAETTSAPPPVAETTAPSVKATTAPKATTKPSPKPTKTAPKVTASQEQAIGSAESYLEYSAFSRKGLIDQLVYEGFSKADATYGVDHVTVDWKEQAAKSAKSYLETSHFSRRGLIEQLEYEGFSRAQATYGVTKAGL